jgi:hypothetical protein
MRAGARGSLTLVAGRELVFEGKLRWVLTKH